MLRAKLMVNQLSLLLDVNFSIDKKEFYLKLYLNTKHNTTDKIFPFLL